MRTEIYSLRITLLFALMSVIYSCKQKPNHKKTDIRNAGGIHLSGFMDSLLQKYSNDVKSNYGYAVYIDKKNEATDYMITIAPFVEKVSLQESGAVNYFNLSDSVPVFLFTGIEDFVSSDNPLFARANETIPEASQGKEFKELTMVKTKIDFSQALSYVHVDDTTYTVMGENIPFSTLTLRPTIIFQPPDSIKK